MQTKLCPKCGTVNSDEADQCECGFSFGSEVNGDSIEDLLGSSLAGLPGGGSLSVAALAIAGAIFWGAAVFLTTWWLIFLDGSTGERLLIGRLYPGYSVSPLGSLIGLLWGVADGAISGAILAWLYNVALLRLSGRKRG